MNEFELIARFFDRPLPPGSGVARGVGDDCALLDFGGTTQLAVTADMLVAGRHFLADADPRAIGHKALAVNLSDLAAAGAQPRCFFLAVALPEADPAWLQAFSDGLFALAGQHGCALAGGDTTRVPVRDGVAGPLTLSITAIGEVPRGAGVTRAGATPGDDIWVSGELGGAALALLAQSGAVTLDAPSSMSTRQRLDWPSPRVALGTALRGLASACIDVSDGLIGDIGHILARSKVGARLEWANVPRDEALRSQSRDVQLRCALAGGDDYELAFAASRRNRAAIEAAALAARTSVTRVGAITDGRDLVVVGESDVPMDMPFKAYDHFGTYDATSGTGRSPE